MLESPVLEITRPGLSVGEMLWPETPVLVDIPRTETHIFAAQLDDSLASDFARASLSRDEKDRANRFHRKIHKTRFIAGRSLIRLVLGRYLGVQPATLRFIYSREGKPALDPSFTRSDLRFNLAHSEDLALLAVTRSGEIGVDVEHIRPIPDAAALVARFFSSRESHSFNQLPEDVRPAAFFNLWTRKEAWLKATGEGIAHSLNQVEVSFLPHEPARLLSLPSSRQNAAHWTLRELHPARGVAAAFAVASFPIQLRCFSWPTQPEL
jgi:4'-phosphopantetheinyl transferase